MWRDIAGSPMLWRTVRMKNSQVHSFVGLANALKKHGTVHLDLRKMLLPSTGDDIWHEFSKAITPVDTLRKIEFCRFYPVKELVTMSIRKSDMFDVWCGENLLQEKNAAYVLNKLHLEDIKYDSIRDSVQEMTNQRGRPCKLFMDLGSKRKKQKLMAVFQKYSTERLTFAARTSLEASGQRNTLQILKGLSDPENAYRIKKAITTSTLEATQILLQSQIQDADTDVKLQALVNHTTHRIIETQNEVFYNICLVPLQMTVDNEISVTNLPYFQNDHDRWEAVQRTW
ncbi:hypothetical protein YQE_02399, partial [Dendroctonus ponderosae]